MAIQEVTFDIPQTPENLAAMEEIKHQAASGSFTIYRTSGDGKKLLPVAKITKHPDCPDDVYLDTLRRLSK